MVVNAKPEKKLHDPLIKEMQSYVINKPAAIC